MNQPFGNFNPGSRNNPAALANEMLARLRAAILSRSHWVLAADSPEARALFRELEFAVRAAGANSADLIWYAPDLFVAGQLRTVPCSFFGTSKTALTTELFADVLATFLDRFTGFDADFARETVLAGNDLLPLGDGADLLVEMLAQMVSGKSLIFDPNLN